MAYDSTKQLAALRDLLTTHKLDAYIILSTDTHDSEYKAARDKRREFISGMTGTAGDAIVTRSQAFLWTDSRYHEQATRELDANWTLMKDGTRGTPTIWQWLMECPDDVANVGIDPCLATHKKCERYQAALQKKQKKLVMVPENLVDVVWGHSQPHYPEEPVYPLEMGETGKRWQDKVDHCREMMRQKHVDCLVLSVLDEVAWLFNLRGSDVPFCPVFFAYAIITIDEILLFIRDAIVTEQVRLHLGTGDPKSVDIQPYENVFTALESYASSDADGEKCFWFSNRGSHALVQAIGNSPKLIEPTPIALTKIVKNEVEIEGFINCHIRDAVALCRFFSWMEKDVPTGSITEYHAAKRAESFRAMMDGHIEPSFETISAVGGNGSVIHYRPKVESKIVTVEELYLVDSGSHYNDGTIDVTRTLHFGTPTDFEKECYTRVLQGLIRLATATFPKGTSGKRLDCLARLPLWEAGLDYDHGTGHGVGSVLGVHEDLVTFSSKAEYETEIQKNMVLTIEPGYYEAGRFGIRLENMFRVVDAHPQYDPQGRGYLTFLPLTVVPFQRKMILTPMLSPGEIAWIDNYHQRCFQSVSPHLDGKINEDTLNWLERETKPICS